MRGKGLNRYNLEFKDLYIKIGKALNIEPKDVPFKIIIQKPEFGTEIPNLGRKFGVLYDEKGNLILAKWLFDLSSKEQNVLIDFILNREVFRLYFNSEIGEKHDLYNRFTDIMLQIITS